MRICPAATSCRLLSSNSIFQLLAPPRGYTFANISHKVSFSSHSRAADEDTAALNSCHFSPVSFMHFGISCNKDDALSAKAFLTDLSATASPFGFSRRKLRITRWQGRINHWASQANARDLTLLGLNIKTFLYCFFRFLDCSQHVKLYRFLITAFSVSVKETDNFGIYRFWVT